MVESSINVFFDSCANLARSLLAEAGLNQLEEGRFHALSCGLPDRTGDPVSNSILDILATAGFPAKGLHSKS